MTIYTRLQPIRPLGGALTTIEPIGASIDDLAEIRDALATFARVSIVSANVDGFDDYNAILSGIDARGEQRYYLARTEDV